MTYSTLRSALAVGMAIILASSVASAGAVQTDAEPGDGATTIDSCTTITESGVYELSGDLANATANTTIFGIDGTEVTACVVVAADDVVFDGNGHAVDGGGVTTGLDETNVSIANQTTNGTVDAVGAVNESNASTGANETLDVGVAVLPQGETQTELTNVTVRNVRSSDWFAGVYVENVTKSTITGVDASGNAEIGFEFANATFSVVDEVRAADNGGLGVLVYGAEYNALTSIHAENNGYAGFVVGESNRNKFADVHAANQSIAGIALFNASHNVVTGVDVRETAGEGYPITGGLVLDNASNNFLADVTSADNENWTYYSSNGSVDNAVLDLTDDGRTVSFVATDVAIRFDERTMASSGTPLVIVDTSPNASIVVDSTWTAVLTGAFEGVTVDVASVTAVEVPAAGPNATASESAG
jgi:hypothetical protein